MKLKKIKHKIINFIHFKIISLPPSFYGINSYSWNDGLLDVKCGVDLNNRELTKLPYDFGVVHEKFSCSQNYLFSLKGSPKHLVGSFNCSENQLDSLEYSPSGNIDSFMCRKNKIKNLKYAPMKVWTLDCSDNDLKDLTGDLKEVVYFICKNNPLISFEGTIERINNLECSLIKYPAEIPKKLRVFMMSRATINGKKYTKDEYQEFALKQRILDSVKSTVSK